MHASHLELVKVLYLANEVVLQIKDLEVGAHLAQQFNLLDTVLVQCDLFQRRYHALIVLGALRSRGEKNVQRAARSKRAHL